MKNKLNIKELEISTRVPLNLEKLTKVESIKVIRSTSTDNAKSDFYKQDHFLAKNFYKPISKI